MNILKRNKYIRNVYAIFRLFTFEFRFSYIKNIFWYIRSYHEANKVINANFSDIKLYPCLDDRTALTPIDPVYFFQDTWAARKIFELKPERHYDVGSSVKTIGILSQFVPVTMIDIRPLPLNLSGMDFNMGSILDLPFEDCSIESISSLCVVEHIGLGRYGDPIDSFGSEKAIIELKRVVSVGGVILFSVPVDSMNTIYFNAAVNITVLCSTEPVTTFILNECLPFSYTCNLNSGMFTNK